MAAISDFVRTTTYEITSPQLRLPGLMWSALIALNQIHGIWRWHRRTVLYTNPENFTQLLAGHMANYVFGESTLLKIAAQSLLIATRLLKCAHQQISLYNEGKRLIAAIQGHYPAPNNEAWPTHSGFYLFSPSSIYEWKFFGKTIWLRLSRVARILSRLFIKAFTLSMCWMDAIDAFYISPTTKNEAINESCLNIIQWLNTIVEQKETLLQEITENKHIIEKILSHSPFTFTQLQTSISSALATTETLQKHAHKVASFSNGLLVNLGKQSLRDAAIVTGFNRLW